MNFLHALPRSNLKSDSKLLWWYLSVIICICLYMYLHLRTLKESDHTICNWLNTENGKPYWILIHLKNKQLHSCWCKRNYMYCWSELVYQKFVLYRLVIWSMLIFLCGRKYLRETLKIANSEDLNRLTACSLVLLGSTFLSQGITQVWGHIVVFSSCSFNKYRSVYNIVVNSFDSLNVWLTYETPRSTLNLTWDKLNCNLNHPKLVKLDCWVKCQTYRPTGIERVGHYKFSWTNSDESNIKLIMILIW